MSIGKVCLGLKKTLTFYIKGKRTKAFYHATKKQYKVKDILNYFCKINFFISKRQSRGVLRQPHQGEARRGS